MRPAHEAKCGKGPLPSCYVRFPGQAVPVRRQTLECYDEAHMPGLCVEGVSRTQAGRGRIS